MLESQKILRIFVVTFLILLVPFIAMQFTNEVHWGVFDFIIMGALLSSTGFSYELIATKIKTNKQRMIAGAVIFGALAFLWVELAVGVFGSPLAGS